MILLVLAIFPLNTWAYSKYIIPGGNTVGIEVNSKGVLIVGLYDVEGGSNKEFKIGDRIIRINNHEVDTIDRMIEVINSESSNNNFIFEVYRDNDIKKITTNLSKDDNGVLKTGLMDYKNKPLKNELHFLFGSSQSTEPRDSTSRLQWPLMPTSAMAAKVSITLEENELRKVSSN